MSSSSELSPRKALQLAQEFIGTNWQELEVDDIKLSPISGGFSSCLYLCENISPKDTSTRKFLIRFYGGKIVEHDEPIKILTKHEESLLFYAVSLVGIGPKLYGVFDQGRIEQFVPSRISKSEDYTNIDLMKQMARTLARYHALKIPIPKLNHDFLEVTFNGYHDRFNPEKFKKLADALDTTDSFDWVMNFDRKGEYEWLSKVGKQISHRLVTVHGDVNRNNWLILEKPNQFGDTVMLIDYELTCTAARGRDLAMLKINMKFPSDDFYRDIVVEYLDHYKKLRPSETDLELDTIEHLMLEIDLNVLHCCYFILGFSFSQNDSMVKVAGKEHATAWIMGLKVLMDRYDQYKKNFIEKYPHLVN